MRYLTLICLALVASILAVYIQVGTHPFSSFDDTVYITENPHVTGGITPENLLWAFTSTDAVTSNWHPITWVSHMVDAQLYGMQPRGHHFTNVVIHTISSLVLLIFLFRATGSLPQSSFVAALFALHPLHVESVVWAAERKDVLSGLFCFVTLLLYCEFAAKPRPWLYLLSLFTFILGLMSKPMLVTLPVVMVLIDFWPLHRYGGEMARPGARPIISRLLSLLKGKIPFFICSVLSSVITIYAQNKGGAIKRFDAIPLLLRCENAGISYLKYLVKTVWPCDLAVLYPYPSFIPLWQGIGSLVVVLLLCVATIWCWRRYPYLAVGWFWFLLTLTPVIGIIQVGNQSMADRYTYLPLVGIFIMAAWGVPLLTCGFRHQRLLLAALSFGLVIASAALSWRQVGYWRDDIALYRHTLMVTSDNSYIHFNLGVALAVTGDLDGAMQEYREVLRITPRDPKAHTGIGSYFMAKGDLDSAAREFGEAVRITPQDPDAHYNLGVALAGRGDSDAAISEYQETLLLSPDDAGAHTGMGMVLVRKGDLDAAATEFQAVLRITPNDINAQNNLRVVLERKKK